MKGKVKKAKKKNSLTKKVVLLVVLFAAGLGLIVVTFYPNLINNITDQKEDKVKVYRGGSGGDVDAVTKYHDQAVAAWKAGDKSKAKDLAKKGLAENDNLTLEQQTKVPEQSRKVFEMFDITIDKYKGD